ncbi:unnamed protein product [Vitrella brassicaformis CCMP3155]|uniref:Ion transport domain-containing protein n=3 Tax=Vitrella brassicaformis TaxID=1169539 RepID=A0A0G4G6R2_VITBC|nr:unnamed protein product [Vitrella brassicaformis CCMP3155]|eukprot:CEM24366.1 unnamed protein product [Vitrella brassicaformis CCMP3155]
MNPMVGVGPQKPRQWLFSRHHVQRHEEGASTQKAQESWLLDVDGPFYCILWLPVLSSGIFFTLWAVPYQLAFLPDLPQYSSTLFSINVAFDVFFVLDILVRFNLRTRHYHRTLSDVFFAYLSSWFVLDLFPCLPIYHIPGVPREFILLRLMRVIRLVVPEGLVSRRLAVDLALNFRFRLVYLVLVVVVVTHWLGCAWYWVGTEKGSWVSAKFGGDPPGTYEVYVNSLYWTVNTLSTIGTDDFFVHTLEECWLAILSAFLAILIIAWAISEISQMVADSRSGASSLVRRKVREAVLWRQYVDAPLSPGLEAVLYRSVKDFWDDPHNSVAENLSILDALAPLTRRQLLIDVFRPLLDTFDAFFLGISASRRAQLPVSAAHASSSLEDFRLDVAVALRSRVYFANEVILAAGETCEELLFLFFGDVEVSPVADVSSKKLDTLHTMFLKEEMGVEGRQESKVHEEQLLDNPYYQQFLMHHFNSHRQPSVASEDSRLMTSIAGAGGKSKGSSKRDRLSAKGLQKIREEASQRVEEAAESEDAVMSDNEHEILPIELDEWLKTWKPSDPMSLPPPLLAEKDSPSAHSGSPPRASIMLPVGAVFGHVTDRLGSVGPSISSCRYVARSVCRVFFLTCAEINRLFAAHPHFLGPLLSLAKIDSMEGLKGDSRKSGWETIGMMHKGEEEGEGGEGQGEATGEETPAEVPLGTEGDGARSAVPEASYPVGKSQRLGAAAHQQPTTDTGEPASHPFQANLDEPPTAAAPPPASVPPRPSTSAPSQQRDTSLRDSWRPPSPPTDLPPAMWGFAVPQDASASSSARQQKVGERGQPIAPVALPQGAADASGYQGRPAQVYPYEGHGYWGGYYEPHFGMWGIPSWRGAPVPYTLPGTALHGRQS